jgi:hypothetical protein
VTSLKSPRGTFFFRVTPGRICKLHCGQEPGRPAPRCSRGAGRPGLLGNASYTSVRTRLRDCVKSLRAVFESADLVRQCPTSALQQPDKEPYSSLTRRLTKKKTRARHTDSGPPAFLCRVKTHRPHRSAPQLACAAAAAGNAAASRPRLAGAADSPAGATDSLAGATDSPAGATDSPAGATESLAGATDSLAGATDSPAGATDSPAGATDSPAGATDSPAGATDNLVGTNDSPVFRPKSAKQVTEKPDQTSDHHQTAAQN